MAALVVIVTGVITVPSFLSQYLRPDVIVRVTDNENLVLPIRPSQEWFDEFDAAIKSLPKDKDSTPFRKLSMASHEARMRWVVPKETQHERIEIANQSSRALSGVRVSFEFIFGLYPELTVGGTFLTEPEKDRYLKQIKEMKSITGTKVLLPELPPLPPGGVLVLELYGGLTFEPTVSVPGATSQIVKVVKVDENWVIRFIRNPRYIVATSVVGMVLLVVVAFLTARQRRRRLPQPRP